MRPRRHFTRNASSRNAPFRSASRALLETTPPRPGSAPPAGRPELSCWTDDCDTIEPRFPVRQRDGHASRRESSACFSITRPAATGNSSASRSKSSPTHRARVASTGFSPGRPGDAARGPSRREGGSKRQASEELPRPAVPRGGPPAGLGLEANTSPPEGPAGDRSRARKTPEMPERGLEPPPSYLDKNLNLARLPIPPLGQVAAFTASKC